VGVEGEFKTHADDIKRRLELPEDDAERMPQINDQNPDDITEVERAAIILYIDSYMGQDNGG